MLPHLGTNKTLGWVFLTLLLATPAVAHKIETAQDVGATFHIEPNDIPRVGKPELAWFALTLKGGKVVSLKDCNCQLVVYSKSYPEGSPPIQKPLLKALSIKQYQNIPSAEITFPAPGAYQLQLTGIPVDQGDFTPFELKFDVTVAPGAAPTLIQSAQIPKKIEQPENQWLIPAIATATILSLGIIGIVWRRLK